MLTILVILLATVTCNNGDTNYSAIRCGGLWSHACNEHVTELYRKQGVCVCRVRLYMCMCWVRRLYVYWVRLCVEPGCVYIEWGCVLSEAVYWVRLCVLSEAGSVYILSMAVYWVRLCIESGCVLSQAVYWVRLCIEWGCVLSEAVYWVRQCIEWGSVLSKAVYWVRQYIE